MAKRSFGFVFRIGNGAETEAFQAIGGIKSVKPPSVSRESNDTSNHAITDGYMTKIPDALRDGGQITLKIDMDLTDTTQFTHATNKGLYESLHDDDVHNMQILSPIDGDSGGTKKGWSFPGFVRSFTPGEMGVKGNQEADVVIEVAGKPTLEDITV